MSRKDFIVIAAALKAASASLSICETMANHLATTNRAFDRARFLSACGH